ncbi:18633_t:CDS:1 [Racocetra persica]|uniref:18633_t:CDS:1 n=1 Tax=Racocetra persica TaxID=160502 RepID=A0ACA9N4S5_9GLOM|nr:18633_t:CDS:1 [Racocetra persica]
MEPGTLEPNMEPKFVEPKPRKSMEPKRVEPKEPKIVKQIWEHLQQEKLERVLFHYEISEMVREWQQGISEIKHTIKELISQKQVPIVRTSREKKTEPNTRERKRKSLLPPSGLKYKSSEW